MAGTKSKESRYCFIRDSTKLKDVVNYKMEELGISTAQLSLMTGIQVYRLNRYRHKGHWASLPSITQHQLLEVCKVLGIALELDISLFPVKVDKNGK